MSDEPPNPKHQVSPPANGGIFGRRFSARPAGSPYPKAELLPRILARLTDFLVAAFFPAAIGSPGILVSALYLLFADGMLMGQSPGKKLLGIKVVKLETRTEADYRASALRNFPFALSLLVALIPDLGATLSISACLAVTAVEGWRAYADGLGLRLGDRLADTQVVDTKVPVGADEVRPVLRVVRSGSTHARQAGRVLLEPIERCPP